MSTEEDSLKSQIEELENKIKPLKDRLNEVYKQRGEQCQEKLIRVHEGKDKFTLEELRFAAYNRCECGAGFAYPLHTGITGEWDCSAIPTGEEGSVMHSACLPFVFYEIKSELQPSAGGATTRPPSVNKV